MYGDTNRDLILQLQMALARVIQNDAIRGYQKQLGKLDVKITNDELKAFEYVNDEYDLHGLNRMLTTILQTNYMMPV